MPPGAGLQHERDASLTLCMHALGRPLSAQVGVPTFAYNFTWVSDADTPDTLFYQSTARPRMGWLLVRLGSQRADAIIENSKNGNGEHHQAWAVASWCCFGPRTFTLTALLSLRLSPTYRRPNCGADHHCGSS